MAVHLRPLSSAWMAPYALAAQLRAQAGESTGRGYAALGQGIGQGLLNVASNQRYKQEKATEAARYQDSMSLRQQEMGMRERELGLREEDMAFDHAKAAATTLSQLQASLRQKLADMQAQGVAPDSPEVAQLMEQLRNTDSSLNAQIGNITKRAGGQSATYGQPITDTTGQMRGRLNPDGSMPEMPAPGAPERVGGPSLPGMDAAASKVVDNAFAGGGSLFARQQAAKEAGPVPIEAMTPEQLGGEIEALLARRKRLDESLTRSEETPQAKAERASINMRIAALQGPLNEKMAKRETDQAVAKTLAEKQAEAKLKQETGAAAVAALRADLEKRGIKETLPDDLETARKVYNDAVVTDPNSAAAAARKEASAKTRADNQKALVDYRARASMALADHMAKIKEPAERAKAMQGAIENQQKLVKQLKDEYDLLKTLQGKGLVGEDDPDIVGGPNRPSAYERYEAERNVLMDMMKQAPEAAPAAAGGGDPMAKAEEEYNRLPEAEKTPEAAARIAAKYGIK